MKLFSSSVKPTYTNSPHNILQVEAFNEIFFDVFEVEINKKKYPAEKISEYQGNPVVSIPVVLEGIESLYPFILHKGKFGVFFNKNNKGLSSDILKEEDDKADTWLESILNPVVVDESKIELAEISKRHILSQISEAKLKATQEVNNAWKQKSIQLKSQIKEDQKVFELGLNKARSSMVEEFLKISEDIKSELLDCNDSRFEEIVHTIDNKIEVLSNSLKESLDKDFNSSSKLFDSSIKQLVKDLYLSTIVPQVDTELKSIAQDIVEKVDSIDKTLNSKLEDKADIILLEDITSELDSLRDSNIELNNTISKGINKALSRVGNVNTKVDELTIAISEELDSKILQVESNINKFYTEKLNLLEEKTFDITEETRKYIIELVQESRNNLIQEIRQLKNEKPIEYVIESTGKREIITEEKLLKEYDKKINTRIDNEVTKLRRYISVYSGGGSVAMQFAAGGTMGGNLNIVGNLLVVGTISASSYLGLPSLSGGGTGTSILSSDNNFYGINTFNNTTNFEYPVNFDNNTYYNGNTYYTYAAQFDDIAIFNNETYFNNNSVILNNAPVISNSSAVFGSVSALSYLGLPAQVDIDNFLPLSGGTLTGTVNIPALSASSAFFNSVSSNQYSGISKGMVGLSQVDNTSDINKPVSTSTQNALNLKLDSVIFNNLSANWQNSYTTVQSNSSNWNSAYSTLSSKANITTLSSYLPLSGGTINGDLTIEGVVYADNLANLQDMSQQSSNNVNITGGTIQGVTGLGYADINGLGGMAIQTPYNVSITGGTAILDSISAASYQGLPTYNLSKYLAVSGGNLTGVLSSNSNATFVNISATNYTGVTPTMVGLGNVNNISDINKPVSNAQQLALNLKLDTAVFNSLSTNWQNTYNTVNINNANWTSASSTVNALSANWQNSYTTVNANSANWQTVSNKLALSGGNITGQLSSNSNAIFVGLSTSGKMTSSGQGVLSALGANDIITRDAMNLYRVSGPYVNRHDIFVPNMTGANGGGGSYGARAPGFEIWTSSSIGSYSSIGTGAWYTLGALNSPFKTCDWTRTIFMDTILNPVATGDATGTRLFCGLGRPLNASQYATLQYGGIGFLINPINTTTYNIRLMTGTGQFANHAITGATNTSPISCTCSNHGYVTGNYVDIIGVGGNTATNNIWIITKLDNNTFSLNSSTGNGAYTSGGYVNQTSPVLSTGTLGNMIRVMIKASGGTAYLYLNDLLTGSLSGCPTIAETASVITLGMDNLSSTGSIDTVINSITIQSI